MSKHRVRTHFWNSGILETLDYLFDTPAEAAELFGNIQSHIVKLYDADGNLVDTKQASTVPEEVNVRNDQPYYA
jgi:hypothetical protein